MAGTDGEGRVLKGALLRSTQHVFGQIQRNIASLFKKTVVYQRKESEAKRRRGIFLENNGYLLPNCSRVRQGYQVAPLRRIRGLESAASKHRSCCEYILAKPSAIFSNWTFN